MCFPQSYLLGQVETTQGAHFNSFDPAWTIPDAEVNSTFQWSLDYNSSDIYITFNTTEDPPLLTIFNSSCNEAVDTCEESFQGYTATTSGNTQTSLFNFHSIYVGPGVNITVVGERALVLISRSTAIYDTPIRIEPGTVGVRSSSSESLALCLPRACSFSLICCS